MRFLPLLLAACATTAPDIETTCPATDSRLDLPADACSVEVWMCDDFGDNCAPRPTIVVPRLSVEFTCSEGQPIEVWFLPCVGG